MKTPTDATNTTGASADGGNEEGAERQLSPREIMMNQIGESHQLSIDAQVHQAESPEKPVTTEGEAIVIDDPTRFKLRVKIGDREEERPLDTVVNELQSSQGRLRVANQREKELLAELAEKDQQLAAQLAAGTTTSTDSGEVDQRMAEAMDALINGDGDKAAEAMKAVIGSGRSDATPLDEAAVARRVKEELAREQAEKDDQAVFAKFEQDYPELRIDLDPVTGDPIVVSDERRYANYLFEKDYQPLMQAGKISYQQALTETATAVRAAFKKSDPPPAPVSEFEQRQKRKQELDHLPVAAGARATTTESNQPESPADVIREMRLKRGLPV